MPKTEPLSYLLRGGHKPGLGRVRALLAGLGDPQKHLKCIHIAGTNGKGSTAAMLASCLRAAGIRTGLFTSPFLSSFYESICVDGAPISKAALEQIMAAVRPIAEGMADAPTEFELSVAAAFSHFLKENCGCVVLEVGMGGGGDATNVIDAPELAVITALGLDHTRQLGPTIADIAAAKAGIIKPGTAVVSYGGVPEADAVIAAACRQNGAALYPVDFSLLHIRAQTLDGTTFDFGSASGAALTGLRLPLLGSYQPKNAATAITALRVLQSRGWPISGEAIRQGLLQVRWPGRFELLRKAPVFLLDGSHNPHGMAATVESLRGCFPGQKFTFLMSVMADKDLDGMLALLCPLAERFVAVAADNPRALPAEALAAHLRAHGALAESCESISAGVARALALSKGGPVCALGTLYFSGAVRQAFFSLSS